MERNVTSAGPAWPFLIPTSPPLFSVHQPGSKMRLAWVPIVTVTVPALVLSLQTLSHRKGGVSETCFD